MREAPFPGASSFLKARCRDAGGGGGGGAAGGSLGGGGGGGDGARAGATSGASFHLSQPPTAIAIARSRPIHVGQFRASLSARNLMIVKSRMPAASAAEITPTATGMLMFCLVSRSVSWTASHTMSATTRMPTSVPQPAQPERELQISPTGVSTQASCHARKRSMNSSTPAPSNSFVAVLRSARLGIGSLSVSGGRAR
jgi:hypothetical protein